MILQFVGVAAAPGSANHSSNGGTGTDPSVVQLAGITSGMELLGIDDQRVDCMEYEKIMGLLRSRAVARKELHFREPPPRAEYFSSAAASLVRRASSTKKGHGGGGGGAAAAADGSPQQGNVKPGTVIEVDAPAGDLGMTLQPASKARGTGAVAWSFDRVLTQDAAGAKKYTRSPVQLAGVAPGMQLVVRACVRACVQCMLLRFFFARFAAFLLCAAVFCACVCARDQLSVRVVAGRSCSPLRSRQRCLF